MTNITFLMGANATGKSTRFRTFVDSLGETYEDYARSLTPRKGSLKSAQ